MGPRADLKAASLQRILDAAALRLRQEGLSGAAIAAVMREAGLTHGAFYCHFTDKQDLEVAALRHALKDNRARWVGRPRAESWGERLARLGRRYLTPRHRDDRADGCALAALAGDAGRSARSFKAAYQQELLKSLHAICAASGSGSAHDPLREDSAIAFLALCVGGLSLARAVEDEALSDRILAVCRQASGSLPAPESSTPESSTPESSTPESSTPESSTSNTAELHR